MVLLEGEGNGSNRDKSRFLHCAPHDEAVRRFGRNDDSFDLRIDLERRTSNSKDKMRGFFAALRMTKEKREIRLTGKPRRSAALCGVVAPVC